ncbi:hypothetical protein F2Q69_00061784 [Brassica cretica]|uniref:Uncharacterized protein n=1 Tax=Brassica cretica TaxID=69181 RepID=A0A8S9RE60_BRACR|nr:hypothetical protein F2Q69_00061784 [Brassica cretica]
MTATFLRLRYTVTDPLRSQTQIIGSPSLFISIMRSLRRQRRKKSLKLLTTIAISITS